MRPIEESIDQATVDAVRIMLGQYEVEEVISGLRARGFSKILCIGILARTRKYSLTSAKEVVHESSAWSDVRQRDDDLHEKIFELIEKMEERKEPK